LIFLTELQDSTNITELEFGFWGVFLVTKEKRAIYKICEAIPEGKLQKKPPKTPVPQHGV